MNPFSIIPISLDPLGEIASIGLAWIPYLKPDQNVTVSSTSRYECADLSGIEYLISYERNRPLYWVVRWNPGAFHSRSKAVQRPACIYLIPS